MKKLLLTALCLGSAAAATAAPVLSTANSFTGAGVELGAGTTKSDIKNVDLGEDYEGDVALRGSYMAQFGTSNWVGGAEASWKPLHRTVADTRFGEVKQKSDFGLSYVQGYRLTNDVLAYGKVGYRYGKFDSPAGETNMDGVGYGLGAKYAVTPNVEVGAEWEQARFKKDDLKVKNNSFMATVGYRFR